MIYRAEWRDRVSADGSLIPMKISGCSDLDSLDEQFPNSCKVSKNFIGPLWGSRKIIIYKSNLRLSTGQHKIWGDVGPDTYTNNTDFTGSVHRFVTSLMLINELLINQPELTTRH